MRRYQHWTPLAVALLSGLWPDHSASVIAGRLSASGLVVTRNAVIGKAHRIGLIKGPANVAQSENVGNRSNGATLKPGRWRREQ